MCKYNKNNLSLLVNANTTRRNILFSNLFKESLLRLPFEHVFSGIKLVICILFIGRKLLHLISTRKVMWCPHQVASGRSSMENSGGGCVLRMGVPRNLRGEATVQGTLVLKEVASGLVQPISQGNQTQQKKPGYTSIQNCTNFSAL
jgi:hypothetical protein